MPSKGLEQAYRVQDFAFNSLMALQDAMTVEGKLRAPDKEQASTLGVAGKVWKDAQEQVRIHRGKPLPGSLTHEKVKRGSVGKRDKWQSMMQNAGLPVEQPDEQEPLEQADQPEQPPSNLPT